MAAHLSARGRLRALLVVQVASRIGNVVTTVSVPFAVLARGGSATDVGITAFMATVPIVLGGPFGGALVERIGFVRSSIASDVVSGVTLLAMPVLAWTVGLPFWALLALVFVSGLLDMPGESARRVLLPGLATEAGVHSSGQSGSSRRRHGCRSWSGHRSAASWSRRSVRCPRSRARRWHSELPRL